MIIGLPKALLYYRYHILWEAFFRALGCQVVTSGDTRADIAAAGIQDAIGETCLPLKLYLGHVRSLIGRCDYIFIPRITKLSRNNEMCVRFLGLRDIVYNTYPDARMIGYTPRTAGPWGEWQGFMRMGARLGVSPARTQIAYFTAKRAQQEQDLHEYRSQQALLTHPALKVLICAQPYLMHDPLAGMPVGEIIAQQGGIALYSDRCDRHACRLAANSIAPGLYWVMHKEAVGAAALYHEQVDGVVLLAAFPCGADALANEMALRRVKHIPVIQIMLDEQQGRAGLHTRVESFMDILRQRRQAYG